MACPTRTSQSAKSEPEPDYCILCIGYCVFDIVHTCDEYPKEDTKKYSFSCHWQRGGNCSNMCTVLRQLDGNCEFLGMTSSSPGFAMLLQDCKNRGIITKNCPSTPQEPPLSTIVLSTSTGSRTIIHSDNNYPILTYEDFRKLDLNKYTWINIEAKNPEETLKMLCAICTFNNKNSNCSKDGQGGERKITTSLDLERIKPELISLGEYVDYVVMGKDLAKHMGWKTPYAAVQGLRGLLKTQEIVNYRKPNIIAPWAEKGAAYLSSNDEYELLPADPPEEILDTLGAGDTFNAALIYALHVLRKNQREAVIFANSIAGMKIAQKGYDHIKQFYIAKLTNCACKQK